MAVEHYRGAAAPDNQAALKLLLADDHEMVRIAMRYALAGLAESIAWLEADNAAQVHAILARESGIDLAIVDLNMPGASGIEWIRSLREAHPMLPVLVISATEDSALLRSLIACGVAGFIPKSDSSAVILQAVRLALAGGTYAPCGCSRTPHSPRMETVVACRPSPASPHPSRRSSHCSRAGFRTN